MKQLIILGSFILSISQGNGQSFNKRFVVTELSEGRILSSHEQDLYVMSLGFSEDKFLSCYLRFNSSGEITDSLCSGEEELFNYGFIPNADGTNNNGKMLSLHSFIFENELAGMSYQIFSESGELLRDHRWLSSFYNEGNSPESALALASDAILISDESIFVSYSGSSDQYLTRLDASVIHFSSNDEFIWETQWVNEDTERPDAICYFQDNLFVVIASKPGVLLVDNVISLHKLDPSNGNILESWNDPWNINVTEGNELLAIEDGMVLVGSAIVDSNVYTDAFIAKIDGNVEEQWHQVLNNPDPNFRGYFNEVVQTTDGNYVAAGEWQYSLPAYDEVNGSSNDDGWLVKFDAQTGDIIWDRKYHYIEDVNDEHEIFDLTACADGGVAFTGEALDLTINDDYEYPAQQGWIVKVDEHGCVVPDCHTNIEEQQKETIHFKAGPNPVLSGEEFHIYLYEHAIGGEFVLKDSQGKTVKQFKAHSSSTTYSFPTLGLSSGSYILSLINDNELVQSEQIIIE